MILFLTKYIKFFLMALLFFTGLFIGYKYEHNKFTAYKDNETQEYNKKLTAIIEKSNLQANKDKQIVSDLNDTIDNLTALSNKRKSDLQKALDKNTALKNCSLGQEELDLLNKSIRGEN